MEKQALSQREKVFEVTKRSMPYWTPFEAGSLTQEDLNGLAELICQTKNIDDVQERKDLQRRVMERLAEISQRVYGDSRPAEPKCLICGNPCEHTGGEHSVSLCPRCRTALWNRFTIRNKATCKRGPSVAPDRVCRRCGAPLKVSYRGFCKSCYQYFLAKGRDMDLPVTEDEKPRPKKAPEPPSVSVMHRKELPLMEKLAEE